MKRWIHILLLPLLAIAACKKGSELENLAPETKIFVKEINLTGGDRLNSRVDLYWSGTDKDGYLKGFEISFDNTNWSFVTTQDSTFIFSITQGSDTTDIDFWVRAIDDDETKDPSPAYLRIPIKNTPPTIAFDSVKAVNDTLYSVVSLNWNADDGDGAETMDSIYLKLNNGPWYAMDANVSFVTLVPQDPTAVGAQDAQVYKGLSPQLLSGLISGLMMEGDNRAFVKVKDIAGAESAVDSTDFFYVKRKSSDLLVIDAHDGFSSPTPESVYFPLLSSTYGNFDYVNLATAGGVNIPDFWDPTGTFWFGLYDIVFIYADGNTIAGSIPLESMSGAIQNYLLNGGKLLVSSKFPSTFNNEETSIIGTMPMDSLSSSAGQARITTDSLIMPEGAFAGNFDTLQSSALISGADPFYPAASADVMYRAQVTRIGGWQGPDVVCARTTNASNQTNLIFWSVELHLLNARPAALQGFFNQAFGNEFNW